MGDTLYFDKDMYRQFMDGIPSLKLRKITHKQVALMFELLLFGGLRISEVLQITPSSLIGGNKIKLWITKGGWERCKCAVWEFRPIRLKTVNKNCDKCKGVGKYRIPVSVWIDNDEVYHELELLAMNRKPDSLLFPISRSWAWHYANQLLNARTHSFRHTFLTWMLQSGKFDIRDIKQKARHTSLGTTSRYIENNDDLTQQKAKGVFERI
jgi:integrase